MQVGRKTAQDKSKRPLIRSKHNMFRFRPTRERLFVQKIKEPENFPGANTYAKIYLKSPPVPSDRGKRAKYIRSSSVGSVETAGDRRRG